jgi:hypothetical protein
MKKYEFQMIFVIDFDFDCIYIKNIDIVAAAKTQNEVRLNNIISVDNI